MRGSRSRSLPRPVLIAVAFVLVLPGHARADGDRAAAARAFSQAQSVELRGDHERAAELYELAHEIVPAPEALRAAARARQAAGQRAVAATHAWTLVREYAGDSASRKLGRELLQRLSPQLTRITVRCADPCFLAMDSGAVSTAVSRTHRFFVEPGPLQLEASFGGERRSEAELRAKPGKRLSVKLEPPEEHEDGGSKSTEQAALPPQALSTRGGASSDSTAQSEEDEGLSRLWFALGAGLTISLGAASVWSGMDVLDRHEAYEQMPTQAGYEDGRRRERRTNILLGATAAAAASTALIAFFTDWRGGSKERDGAELTLTPGSESAALSVRGSF